MNDFDINIIHKIAQKIFLFGILEVSHTYDPFKLDFSKKKATILNRDANDKSIGTFLFTESTQGS